MDFDVMPLSLGIELHDITFEKVIDKNSRIPCKQTKQFETVHDYQVTMFMNIYEGVAKFCATCHGLYCKVLSNNQN
jgi:molecular chaperone DnaK (HSP70)